ncbi:hypothetical protein COB55_04345 [Candidatus Wolfebacteria bacterium]|nr:MAG: hypothetical protein COB55_04345 [Candidatus Wolfebacteria bacterium]
MPSDPHHLEPIIRGATRLEKSLSSIGGGTVPSDTITSTSGLSPLETKIKNFWEGLGPEGASKYKKTCGQFGRYPKRIPEIICVSDMVYDEVQIETDEKIKTIWWEHYNDLRKFVEELQTSITEDVDRMKEIINHKK